MSLSYTQTTQVPGKDSVGSYLGDFSVSEIFKHLGRSLYCWGLEDLTREFKVLVGYSNSDSPKRILDQYCEPQFIELGLNLIKPTQAVTLEQFWWTLKQAQGNVYGVYINNSLFGRDYLSLRVFYSDGTKVEELRYRSLIQLLRYKSKVVSACLKGFTAENQIEEVNVSGYLKFLQDSQKIFQPITRPLVLDTMFGSAGPLSSGLAKTSKKINVFNLEAELPRLMHYTAIPTGDPLKWYTTHQLVTPDTLFFSISDDGTRLGVYDVKQNVELSSDSTTLLVLSAIKELGLQTGKVALSAYHGKLVIRHATRLGFITKRFFDAPPQKAEFDVRAGGFKNLRVRGCDNYDALTASSLIYKLCVLKNKSPGELVDEIIEGFREEISRTRELVFYSKEALDQALTYLIDSGIIPSFTFPLKAFYRRTKSYYPGLYVKVARDPETGWYYIKLESAHPEQLHKFTESFIEAINK